MKHYFYENRELASLPDPFRGVSPMTDARFVALGGTIVNDGKPDPKESVVASLNTLLHSLAGEVQGITIAEFKAAAQTMYSGELVDYSRQHGVSEEIIASARVRIMEIMADALRVGVTWSKLIEGIQP